MDGGWGDALTIFWRSVGFYVFLPVASFAWTALQLGVLFGRDRSGVIVAIPVLYLVLAAIALVLSWPAAYDQWERFILFMAFVGILLALVNLSRAVVMFFNACRFRRDL
ncbi:MAG: hypothetical protein HY040_26290 [Planctomycetes bacterium]|nr:hypothetical protein [Planctomycetota bacterium]